MTCLILSKHTVLSHLFESLLFCSVFFFVEINAVLLTDVLILLQEKDQKYVFSTVMVSVRFYY